MLKNILLCVVGVVVGFGVGFYITNAITNPSKRPAVARPAATATGPAAPLDPEDAGGELPEGHPDIAGGASSAAATSAEAQAAMDKADRAPKDFDAQVAAARIFYGLHDYDKSALYLDRALALKPKDFDALVLMGNTKYDATDFAAAATFYERALAVNPDSADVRTDFGNTFFNRKDYDRAIAEYRKALAVDPEHLNGWKNLAAAAINKKDKAAAREAVGRLDALAPGSPEIETLRKKLDEMQY